MSIGSFFTKKIGPLPVWGYGAIAAGGTFLLLKGGGAGGKSGSKKAGAGANGAANGNGSTGNFSGTSNITDTYSGDQTFGGGALGFLGGPWPHFGHINTHLHFGGDRWHRGYSAQGFRNWGFDSNGRHGGRRFGSDNRHGFAGGRNFRGPNNGGGTPRGFGQGHYTPSGGIGSRIASSFNPRNTGNRGTRYGGLSSDALPTGSRR